MNDKKVLLIYGLIGGLITVAGFFLWPVLAGEDSPTDMDYGQLIGYGFMLIALSTVFFGLRTFREKNGGTLTFKEGFLNGMIVVVIASVIYVIGWMIYYPNFMPDFVDTYTNSQIELLKQKDYTEEELAQEIDSLKDSMEMYQKPYIMSSVSFMEIFPVGLVMTLAFALILRRKEAKA